MATKVKENEEAEVERDGASDGPLLDLSDDAVKKMIKAAKKRGYVTMDELNAVLPSEEVTSEQIEDTMAMLSDMGINVIEDEEAEEAGTAGASSDDDDNSSDEDGEGGELSPSTGTAARGGQEERADRPHRRPRAHVLARDGFCRAVVARRRNRHRKAHRGRPRDDDRWPLREPADVPGPDHLARRTQRRHDAAARDHRSRNDLFRS